jgi:hypothetical protein
MIAHQTQGHKFPELVKLLTNQGLTVLDIGAMGMVPVIEGTQGTGARV